jgi:hypothetical protein
MNGSTETPSRPLLRSRDLNWSGQTTAAAQFKANPTWATVLTGDGYTAYASSTATNRGTLSETSTTILGRIHTAQTRSPSIHPPEPRAVRCSRIRITTGWDESSPLKPHIKQDSETAYDGAGRSYQSRTVLDLESTKYSSGAFVYRDPQPQPTMSSMTGGDDSVLTYWSTACSMHSGNVSQNSIRSI